LEAKVKVTIPSEYSAAVNAHSAVLRELFIVSGVTVEQGTPENGASPVRVEVLPADGTKCERCWSYSTHVGENKEVPTVCERCSQALREAGLVA